MVLLPGFPAAETREENARVESSLDVLVAVSDRSNDLLHSTETRKKHTRDLFGPRCCCRLFPVHLGT